MATERLQVKLDLETGQYRREARRAQTATKAIGTSLISLGTVGVAAVAALAAGLAKVASESVKLAAEFETSLSRMEGLVGLASDEVDQLRESVLSLSGATARAPQELAEAMFFITSAGLRGAEATQALEVSAKAAAAGLGETKDVAFAAVSAVNAYGAENLSAAQAVDILTNTVRQGNVEAADVAGVLGNIIPIAAELGIGFDEVGAALAAMTRLGADATSSATSLQAIMTTLIKPSADAETTLRGVGLSIGELRRQAGEGGILPVLLSLSEAFDGNVEAMGAIFPNARALRGVLNLVGQNAETTEEIFAELANSTGVLDEAFGVAADTGAFQLQQAMTNLKISLTETGEQILPQLAGALEDNQESIEAITEAIGNMAVSLVGIVTDFAPLIGFIGDMFFTVETITNNLSNLFNNVERDIGAAILRAQELRREIGAFTEDNRVRAFGFLLQGTTVDFEDLTEAGQSFIETEEELAEVTEGTADEIRALAEETGITADELEDLADRGVAFLTEQFELNANEAENLIPILRRLADELQIERGIDAYAQRMQAIAESYGAVGDAAGDAAGENNELATSFLNVLNARRELQDPLFAAARSQQRKSESREALGEARAGGDPEAIARAQLDFIAATAEADIATENLAENFSGAFEAMLESAEDLNRDGLLEALDTIELLDNLRPVDIIITSASTDEVNRSTAALIRNIEILRGVGPGPIAPSTDPRLGQPIGRFGSGGFSDAHVPILVGENGPEIITPRVPIEVIPNHRLGGGSTVINLGGISVTGVETADPLRLARSIRREMDRELASYRGGVV